MGHEPLMRNREVRPGQRAGVGAFILGAADSKLLDCGEFPCWAEPAVMLLDRRGILFWAPPDSMLR